MKKISLSLIILALFTLTFTACKKYPGPGGMASIHGKVLMKQYSLDFSSLTSQYPASDQLVYIIYGDNVSYGDNIRTSYDGQFEFKYLQKGNYKIYIYSEDSTAIIGPPYNPTAPKIAILKNISIGSENENYDAGILVSIKNK